jgi:flagellar biogenesis protein FliO
MTVMKKFLGFSIVALMASFNSIAGVKVTSVDLTTNGSNGFVSISLDGRTNDLPDVKVFGRMIEVTLTGSEGFNAIFKNVRGAQLSANSLNGKAVVKAILPYEIPSQAVEVGFKNSQIEVIFPRGNAAQKENKTAYEGSAVSPQEIKPVKIQTPPVAPKATQNVVTPVIDKVTENKVSKEILNEDYLNKLMKEEGTKKVEEKVDQAQATDVVNVKQSAMAKVDTKINNSRSVVVPKASESNNQFSFAGYALKFTIFLAVVLGLFYGIVQLLKKGVFKRGKLGFLNNSQMIEVLSTTYVAPKRSLLVVKAHKQIFLVANSESGLTFLSEMTDTNGLIKEGEKFVTGTNFDMNLGAAEQNSDIENFLKVKENIMESTPINEDKGLAKIAVAKDIVKFSDELKKKAKKLKPIEFN